MPQGQYNYGWGTYNTVSHTVEGNQIFVIQLPDDSYRKVKINDKTAGTYSFTLAELDGANEINRTIASNGGPSDNALFGYYSITNDVFVNREPAKSDWDICFLQYNAVEYGSSFNQRVVGVLQHPDVEVAKISLDNATDIVDASSAVFSAAINAIGYDWKELNYATFQWEIPDTLVYLIKAQNGDYWELRFTAFGGTSTGNIAFTKTKIGSANITENSISLFEMYPNPSNGLVTIAVDAKETVEITWINMHGQQVNHIQHSGAFTTLQQDLSHLEKGMYFVKIRSSKDEQTIKMILN